MLRIAANLYLLFSLLFLPWWFTLGVGVFFIFLVRGFYESIAWGMAVDLLYGTGVSAAYGYQFFVGTFALVFFLAAELFKKQIRFYN